MVKINIELNSLKDERIESYLEETLLHDEIKDKLRETLEKDDLTLKLSLEKNDTINIKKIGNIENSSKIISSSKEQAKQKEEKKDSFFKKFLKSTHKVFEEFFDSVAKKFLKEKFKWNYSVYNDGKKAIIAAQNKDMANFLKKGTDSILYTLKKIPASTKKIIKNTKNVAIDEIFSWKNDV